MNRFQIQSGALLSTLILSACLALGLGIARAEQHGGHGMHGSNPGGHGMHGGGGKHGGGMHGGGCKHQGGMHGGGCKHQGGMHGAGKSGHIGSHLYGEDWRASLSDEQQSQLDRLHVAYAKSKAPRKARMNALKVELTVLAAAAEPDKEAMNAKIDEYLQIKRDAMRAKYGYIAAQRQVLTPDQQVSFDMQMVHKAMHGGKGH